MRFAATFFLLLSAGLVSSCASKPKPIAEQEIVRRSQELFDAVAVGDKTPWQKYVADDVLYFDEKGRNMDKTALVADVEPLPKGYTGVIKIANSKIHYIGDAAIHSFDEIETETIYGQEMHARYHETDTWMVRNGEWKIVAGQVLRYYEDPAAGTADATKMKQYAGTYELAPGVRGAVTLDGGKLYWAREGGQKTELIPEACDIFFRKGVEGRMVFRTGELISRRNNEDVVWKKVG